MPVLSAKHKVLFLLAPGTGSSAVSKGVLLPSLDGTYVPAESIRDEAGNVVVSHWHATVSDLRRFGLLSDEELKGPAQVHIGPQPIRCTRDGVHPPSRAVD